MWVNTGVGHGGNGLHDDRFIFFIGDAEPLIGTFLDGDGDDPPLKKISDDHRQITFRFERVLGQFLPLKFFKRLVQIIKQIRRETPEIHGDRRSRRKFHPGFAAVLGICGAFAAFFDMGALIDLDKIAVFRFADAAGEEFDPRYYLEYLTAKMKDVYGEDL